MRENAGPECNISIGVHGGFTRCKLSTWASISSIVSDLGLSNMSHKRFQRHKRFHEPSVYSLKQGEL